MSTRGTRLIDIEYGADGRILTLKEQRDGKWIDWVYVYSKGGSLLYRKRNIGGVESSLTNNQSNPIPGTKTGYSRLEHKVANCIGFTIHFRVSAIQSGTAKGDRKIWIRSVENNNTTEWISVGTFAYPKARTTVVTTIELENPVTINAFGVSRITPVANSRYSISQQMTDIWVIEEGELGPVAP